MNAKPTTTPRPEWGKFKGVIFNTTLVSNTEKLHFIKDEDVNWVKFTNYTESRNFATDFQGAREYEIKKDLVATRRKLIDNNHFHGDYWQEIETKNPFNLTELINYKNTDIQELFKENPFDFDKINSLEFIEQEPKYGYNFQLIRSGFHSFVMMSARQISDVYVTNGVNHPKHDPTVLHQTSHMDGDATILRPTQNMEYDLYVYERQFIVGETYFNIFPFVDADLKSFKETFDL